MANVEERLATFKGKRWIFKTGGCSALNMAKAGFVCTTKSSVQCYYCGKELDSWNETDDPWVEHRKHAGYCPFVNKYETTPDPAGFTKLEEIQLEKGRILLQMSRRYEEAKSEIEKIYGDLERNLTAKARKSLKQTE